MQNVLELGAVKDFINTCHQSWLKGWNERNGGNMSYRLKPEEVRAIEPFLLPKTEWIPIGLTLTNLAGECFIVTGSGKYFMNVLRYPENNICIIRLDDAGEKYRIEWGLSTGGLPTSELPTHLLNHSIKKEKTNGAYRVILHGHPVNTIALSFLIDLTDKAFTREIWEMMPECSVKIPGGVGVLPWMVCGSTEIAVATGEKIKEYDVVVWAHHGIFCAGLDFDDAFGLMDTVEKAAEIQIRIRSCGGKRHTVTKEQIIALTDSFGLDLNKALLED